jgi:hypothetical protein
MTTEHPKLPEPVLDDTWNALGDTMSMRLALDTLQNQLPPRWTSNDVRHVLNALRDSLEDEELSQIRRWGPREYLLIKPLRPDAAVLVAAKAAGHVKALDDLGLIARMVA